MKKWSKIMWRKIFLSLVTIFTLCQHVWAGKNTFNWQTASPSSQGFSSAKLNAIRDSLADKGTKTLLVIRHNKIVFEWYAPGYNATRRHYTASLAKALVGGMSLLLALNDGLLIPDESAWKYIPQWKDHPRKSKISIRHLVTHSSGIEDAEQDNIPHNKLPGWKGAFWERKPDPFTIARDQAPVIFPPGTKYAYSNPGMAMLAYAVTAAMKNASLSDIRSLLRQRIMKPIGVPDSEWSIGYGRTYEVDGLKLVANWGGGSFTARAVARVGRLMLRKGNWQGKQLIDSAWVEKVLQYAGTPLPDRPPGNPRPACALGWYTNFDGVWPRVPRDAFLGSGAGNQTLLVVPSLDLIVVRNGSNLYDPSKGEGSKGGLEKYLFNPLMDAIIGPPYPQSNVILNVDFAPSSSIIRLAPGSDNWPVTWADDDNLYTAYGDGWGFEPKTNIKLSLGIAKVSGSPPDVKGVNIRTKSGERLGQGPEGPKTSGMLMIEGTLYMLVRNTGNSQLAFSKDHGRTWTWCDWKFTTSFGCPTFLNFGPDYSGARDEYVYIYSHDSDSAYESVDQMVMARVPKDNILKRESYEFFRGLDKNTAPVWTSDIKKRGGVFFHPSRCYRSGITCHPGLKRYLWCQVLPKSKDPRGPRFQGGFGIYDAPQPWGPWTTVHFTTNWDIGPGETSSIPTKWISKDGHSAWLLFSGDDCFSLRKITFKLAPPK